MVSILGLGTLTQRIVYEPVLNILAEGFANVPQNDSNMLQNKSQSFS